MEQEQSKKKVTKEGLKKLLGIYRFLLPYKWSLIASLILLTFSTSVFFVFVYFIKNMIDADSLNHINRIALFMGVVILIQGVVSYVRVMLNAYFSEKTLGDIRTSVYNKMISLPVFFFEKNRVGELSSRISSDITQLQEMLAWSLNEMLRQIFILIGGIGIILFTNLKLGLITISTLPLTVAIAFYIGKKVKKESRHSQDELAKANTIVEESFQGIQVVKAFTNELFESLRYKKSIDNSVNVALKAGKYRAALASFIITGVFGGIILMLWQGFSMVKNVNSPNHIEMGELIQFVILAIAVASSVGTLGDLYGRLQKTIGASERIMEILDEKSEVELNYQPKEVIKTGNITFENVSFSYPSRPEIETLKNISFGIDAGQKIALVGPSGMGKSTITRLLLRYYPLNAGQILIDGVNINTFAVEDLRSSMGIVPQDVILFGGSIRENILYGKPNASEPEIEDAARQANALEFINRFPEGFDTIVGERGVQLSGGQKQRIAIARAILKNPRILLLDEATSSLDNQSESLVQDALEKLMENRTSIVIAHRLSTIRNVDRILVISDGQIVEQGTHNELIANDSGSYSQLLKLQMNA